MAVMVEAGCNEPTIETCTGPVPVSQLAVGDRVLTYDRAYQEIRWFGRREIDTIDLAADPDLSPVLIKAGSLGDSYPERDTLVSPAHRVLLISKLGQFNPKPDECLVAASHLVGWPGVELLKSCSGAYIHFMFSCTETVKVNGMWSESLLIRPHASDALPTEIHTSRLSIKPNSKVLPFAVGASQKNERNASRRI